MSNFKQRKPAALLTLPDGKPVPIKAASIVLEVNKPASAFVTSAANAVAGGQFRVLQRNFKTQTAASAEAQNNFFKGDTSEASLIMDDGLGTAEFTGIISQVSPSGRDASIQYALTSPITLLGGMSFSPIIAALGLEGGAFAATNPYAGTGILSSAFKAGERFDGFNIYRATELLYEHGLEVAEQFPPTSELEAQNYTSTLNNLKTGYELFKTQEDVFAGAAIARKGLNDVYGNVNQSGFIAELLPLWGSQSFLQTLVQHVFPKFQLQLSSLLENGTVSQLIEPIQVPGSPFSKETQTLEQSLTDIVWTPGTVSMLPPLCVTLLGQKRVSTAFSANNPYAAMRTPLEMAATFPADVEGRRGRVEQFPAPKFFNTDMGADTIEYVGKILGPVNKSAAAEADPGINLCSLKTRAFSGDNMLKSYADFTGAIVKINTSGLSALQKWAQVIFYGRILSNTSGQMHLPFTPNISVGRTYRIRTDDTTILAARVRRCVHTFRIAEQSGEAHTVVDFDHILVDGATLPS